MFVCDSKLKSEPQKANSGAISSGDGECRTNRTLVVGAQLNSRGQKPHRHKMSGLVRPW